MATACLSKRRARAFSLNLSWPRLALLLLSLSGCAAQQAYRAGERLLATDQPEAALPKLHEALVHDPGNAQYRVAYLQARDAAVTRTIELAERDAGAGRNAAAALDWQRVLVLNPGNERALAGLQTIEAANRQAARLAAAREALARQDTEAARARLTEVLDEQPGNEAAQALLRTVMAAPVVASSPEAALAPAYQRPVSLEFHDASLRQVFDVLARTAGLNFVFDKDVKTDTRVTLALKDSTVEAALYNLLLTNQLEQQVVDANTVLIYPNVPAKQKEYQALRIRTFYLSYADAKSVANMLKNILKSRDVAVEEKLNMVVLRDTPGAIRAAEQLVAAQDLPEPEVMLEVEILEVQRSRLLDLGITWPASATLTPLAAGGGRALTLDDLRHINRANLGVSSLSATLTANQQDTDSDTLANPRIRMRNHEKARILIGDKIPSVTTTVSPGAGGFASESVNYLDVGLTLNVEPSIYLNNEVGIRVSLEVSNLVSQLTTQAGTTAYQIGTRQASTFLQLRDGENQVLAGLINKQERSSANKLPAVGDVPLLGRLFGSNADDSKKTEIVLSITPHVIRNIHRPPPAASEFDGGTDVRFPRRPAPALLAPVATPASAVPSPSAQGQAQ